jgi:hypothetical protein
VAQFSVGANTRRAFAERSSVIVAVAFTFAYMEAATSLFPIV